MKQRSSLVFILLWILAACTNDPVTVPTLTTEAPVIGGVSAIQMAIATDDFAAGTPRIPFVLFDGPERVADVQRVIITAFDLSPATPVPGWTGEAINYSDYAIPYWVVYPELPRAGLWGLGAEITLADGTVTLSQLALEVVELPGSLAVGDDAPPTRNRTLETVSDINQLTSGQDPNPAFYQMTVDEAVASGKPTVVVFSTPAYCQTAICAPVLESAETVYKSLSDQVNFIHLEIYKEFSPELVVADEVDLWGLSSEPWTFVLDSSGKVVARLGGPVSTRELTAVLQPLLP